MAGSLQRPPFKIPSYYCTCKSIKYQKILQRSTTRTATTNHCNNNNQQNPQQLQQQQQLKLQKLLKYCKSLSLEKLSSHIDGCCNISNNSNHYGKDNDIKLTATTTPTTNYVLHRKLQQQQQQHYLQLQLLYKVFKSSKFCNKLLLNRKKLPHQQFHKILFL